MKKQERLVDDYCEGCVHRTRMEGIGLTDMHACIYILDTGKQRPCPPGNGCTVKDDGKRGAISICISANRR